MQRLHQQKKFHTQRARKAIVSIQVLPSIDVYMRDVKLHLFIDRKQLIGVTKA